MKNKNYSIHSNRFERYLNILSDKVLNCMSRTSWDETLYKLVCVRFCKSDESTGDESVADKFIIETVNESQIHSGVCESIDE